MTLGPRTTTDAPRDRLFDWVVAAIVLALPVLGAYNTISSHWRPVGDEATITSRSYLVLTRHISLIGMPSTLSTFASSPVSHPGPMQFWIAAIPTRILGVPGYGLIVAMAALSVVGYAVILAASYRNGGRTTMYAIAIATVGPPILVGSPVNIWPLNPLAAVGPFVVFVVCSWAVINRDRWFWVPLVFFGSFAAQAHLTFALAVAVVSAATLVAWAWRWWATDRHHDRVDGDRSWVAVFCATVVTAVACWSGPLIDQFWGSGNLGRIFRGSGAITDHRSLGDALRRVAGLMLIPPEWSKSYVAIQKPLTGIEWLTVIIFVGLLSLGLGAAIRRRDFRVISYAYFVGAAVIAGILVEMQLPRPEAKNLFLTSTPFVGGIAIQTLLWSLLGVTTWRLIVPLLRNVQLSRTLVVRFGSGLVAIFFLGAFIWNAAGRKVIAIAPNSYGAVEYFAQHLRPIENGKGILVTSCSIDAEQVKGVVAEGLLMGKPMRIDSSDSKIATPHLIANGKETTHLVICPSDRGRMGPEFRMLAEYIPGKSLPGYKHDADAFQGLRGPTTLWISTSKN